MNGDLITSKNRLAARRILSRETPHKASEIVAWPLEKLNAEFTALVVRSDGRGEALKRELVSIPGDMMLPDPDPIEPLRELTRAEIEPTPRATRPDGAADALVEAIQRIAGNVNKPIDADAVREIANAAVKAALADYTPGYRGIELKAGNAEPVKIDGHYHEVFPRVLRACNATANGQHLNVWLAGPAGTGKSTIAEQVAKALGLKFYAVGALTSDYRLMGYQDANGNLVRTPFREAYEHGGVFLKDEMDADHPSVLCAINQALSNGVCAFPDGIVKRHADFVFIGTANTYGYGATAEYVGRNRIDAATLDRFVRIAVGYDEKLEAALVPGHVKWCRTVQAHRRAVADLGLKVIVSPRATLKGAALLTAGESESDVREACLYAGLDANTRDKIRASAGV